MYTSKMCHNSVTGAPISTSYSGGGGYHENDPN